jgi:uncharacterized protein
MLSLCREMILEIGSGWYSQSKCLIILRAGDLEAANKLAAEDPMHASGARTYSILPWFLNEGGFNLRVSLSEQSVEFS